MAFKSNLKLRGRNDAVQLTEQEVQEYIKCSQDIIYFANNYFYNLIKDERGSQNIGLIKLFDFQKKMLKTLVGDDLKPTPLWDSRKNTIGMCSRGSGKCLTGDTRVKIRNKKTGEIKEVDLLTLTSMASV